MTTESVPDALRRMAELFEDRDRVYGDDYLIHGEIMRVLFPNGITLRTAEDFNRFATVKDLVTKLNRYCVNFNSGGHEDSLDDLSVYAQMLQYQDRIAKGK